MPESKHITILKKAREIISKPEAWTRGTPARDADGLEVVFDDPKAVCFCTYGAIQRASPVDVFDETLAYRGAREALRDTLRGYGSLGYPFIAAFNDNTSHDQVLKLFDDTIEREEKLNAEQ